MSALKLEVTALAEPYHEPVAAVLSLSTVDPNDVKSTERADET